MPLEGIQEWNFVKCYPYWLVSYSAILNKKLISISLFSITFELFGLVFFATLLCFLWYSATFWHLIWQRWSSILRDLLTPLQTSQHTSVYPLQNLKAHTCWTLVQEALVRVRGVRMCLWGKGRVENRQRRGDFSFCHRVSASQHRRKSLCTLWCTTGHLRAPAQTHRQANRREGALSASCAH